MPAGGRCLCGHVTWNCRGSATSIHHCHCSMCRRWTGAAFATLVWFKRRDVIWTGKQPKLYRSSPIAVRSHCDFCGTPIHLEYDGGDEMAFPAGTLDHPEDIRPTHHYGIEGRLDWADVGFNLPGSRTRERW
jgi:hypothetical protein